MRVEVFQVGEEFGRVTVRTKLGSKEYHEVLDCSCIPGRSGLSAEEVAQVAAKALNRELQKRDRQWKKRHEQKGATLV